MMRKLLACFCGHSVVYGFSHRRAFNLRSEDHIGRVRIRMHDRHRSAFQHD